VNHIHLAVFSQDGRNSVGASWQYTEAAFQLLVISRRASGTAELRDRSRQSRTQNGNVAGLGWPLYTQPGSSPELFRSRSATEGGSASFTASGTP
jgi:hypothetical protein